MAGRYLDSGGEDRIFRKRLGIVKFRCVPCGRRIILLVSSAWCPKKNLGVVVVAENFDKEAER